MVSPLTYWVDGTPVRHPVRGHARLLIEVRGHALAFSSPEEVEHAIEVLGQRVLPRPSALARARSPEGPLGRPLWGHANQHWLSRLPTDLRPWRVRQELVARLAEGLEVLRGAA